MGYKVWYNYILFKLGKRKILPSRIINSVKVNENNEKLIKIKNGNIIVDKRVKYPYLRESLLLKLNTVSETLEEKGYRLKIYDAYRSYDDQKKSWEKRLKETRNEHPDADIKELERLTSLKVAKPTKGHGGHQTGGAIDVTLIDKDGNELDMGTKYAEHNSKTRTDSKEITQKQMENRKILYNALIDADFVNFPAEWWHYCYGDNMWAAYKNKKKCMYGYIDPPINNK